MAADPEASPGTRSNANMSFHGVCGAAYFTKESWLCFNGTISQPRSVESVALHIDAVVYLIGWPLRLAIGEVRLLL